jgi:hypothetical protein
MALVTTTLASACAAGDTFITVAAATSIAAGRYILVDQELMQVSQAWVSGVTIPVLRGRDGTAVVAHVITANATHFLASDPALPSPGQVSGFGAGQRATRIVSVTATSTLTLPKPNEDLRVILNGTSVITLTIPVPTKELDGCMLAIISNGAAAHVTTFTSGLGLAGSNYDVITNNATGQMALVVFAANGSWNIPQAPAIGGTATNIIGSIA